MRRREGGRGKEREKAREKQRWRQRERQIEVKNSDDKKKNLKQ